MEDDGPGFMSGRVVVERREDLPKDDLRMMIRNEKNGDENRRQDDDDDEKENQELRRVVVKEEEEKDRREEERRERRREDEKRKDAASGGRRVVRMEKSIEDKAENENEPRRTSSRNGGREDERRGETKSPVAKSGAPLAKRSKEQTPDAAEGEKRYLHKLLKEDHFAEILNQRHFHELGCWSWWIQYKFQCRF